MAYQKNRKLVAGIAFRPELLAYLDEQAEQDDRSRSAFINRLLKEHAERMGVDVSVFASKLMLENNKQTA